MTARSDETPRPALPVGALDAFVEVLADADAGTSPDAFYGRLCDVLCRFGGMERAVLFLYDQARRRVYAAGVRGLDPALFEGLLVNPDTAPIARRALEADDIVEAARPFSADVPEAYASLLGERVFCVPIAASGRWVGVVLCDRPGGEPLTGSEHDVLWGLGKFAALASMARIATTEGLRAQELQQRIDLARELHDRVIQRLFGLSLALSGDGPLPEDERRRALNEVQGAVEDLRTVIARPLAPRSRPAGGDLAAELERRRSLPAPFELQIDLACPVPGRLAALAEAVVAEALGNARKHAQPSCVRVASANERGAFVLEVVNDGVGSGAVIGTTGLGLRLAAFEALQEGGVLESGALDPGRWRVRLRVPGAVDG